MRTRRTGAAADGARARQYVHLHLPGQPDVAVSDVCDAIVSVAMRDMDKGSRGISHAEFDAWLASDGGSSTAVRLLLQTLGTAIAGPAGAQTSIFSPFCFFCLGVIVDRLPFFYLIVTL